MQMQMYLCLGALKEKANKVVAYGGRIEKLTKMFVPNPAAIHKFQGHCSGT
jgi:hypothetical protein